MSAGMKFLMERPVLFNAALWAAPMVNVMPDAIKYNRLNEWGKRPRTAEIRRGIVQQHVEKR